MKLFDNELLISYHLPWLLKWDPTIKASAEKYLSIFLSVIPEPIMTGIWTQLFTPNNIRKKKIEVDK